MAPIHPNTRYPIDLEKYLPVIYIAVMPAFNIFILQLSIDSFSILVKYWVYASLMELGIWYVAKKILYIPQYNSLLRWLLAYLMSCAYVCFFLFLEYQFLHLAEGIIPPSFIFTFLRNMLHIFILMTLIESIKSVKERAKFNMDNISLQTENVKAQFSILLQQINPHFLFNSLTTLQAMVRSKDARTEDFIIKLKDVYRQTLKKEKGSVTLEEELEFFNSYMYLMTLRQEEAIFLKTQVSATSLGYHLPVFCLQVLAENCIKHNVVSSANPLYIHVF